MHTRWTLVLPLLLLAGSGGLAQERKTRDTLVREDLADVSADGFWIYNDLPRGIAEAKASGKPLLVVFRCIPCEACAQLDKDIVEQDFRIRDLLQQYVCVRIVHGNGMDLGLFQYDYDQSFAAFFMNADQTIYGRFGTRSHQTESKDDVSLNGFAVALEGALQLHADYPTNAPLLAGKQSQREPAYATPEQFPSLQGQYTDKLDYQGAVAKSCIHCHQIGEAIRDNYRHVGESVPDSVLFPYPHPKSLGIIFDPDTRATIRGVRKNSLAKEAGFEKGDEVVAINGQPLLSMADVQWVLHHAPDEGTLEVKIVRDGQPSALTIQLTPGWRRLDDISWRASSWALRRMTTGGLLLEALSGRQKAAHGLQPGDLALLVKHVGQYGAHAHAKKSGFRQGDVIVAVADHTAAMRESDLFALLLDKSVGTSIAFTVLRDGKRERLSMTTQE